MYWAGLVGDGRPYLLVVDDDVALPRVRGLEVRAEGLWADHVCETPFEHWSVGLEAFAVGLDDPLVAWGDQRGDRVGLGFDLGWEDEGGAGDGPCAYHQWGAVHGEVLVGGGAVEHVAVDAVGLRRHRWGAPDLRGTAWTWQAGGWKVSTGHGVDADGRGLVARAHGLPARHHAPVAVPQGRLARALCADGSGVGWADRLA